MRRKILCYNYYNYTHFTTKDNRSPFYRKIFLQDISIAPFLTFNCLSVPFYDIISANNFEDEHENEIEVDKIPKSATESNFEFQGQKERMEKELNLLKGGQSFSVKDGANNRNDPSKGEERQKFRYQNEGKYYCTILK